LVNLAAASQVGLNKMLRRVVHTYLLVSNNLYCVVLEGLLTVIHRRQLSRTKIPRSQWWRPSPPPGYTTEDTRIASKLHDYLSSERTLITSAKLDVMRLSVRVQPHAKSLAWIYMNFLPKVSLGSVSRWLILDVIQIGLHCRLEGTVAQQGHFGIKSTVA